MQGQAASRNITTGQNFLFWSLHSWELNWHENKKYGDSKGGFCRETLIRNVRCWKRDMVYVTSVFKVLQSCGASTALAGKCYITSFSSSAMCAVTRLALWLAQVHSVVNNISKSPLHRLVCIIATLFRHKTLTNSNKFIHIVTHVTIVSMIPNFWCSREAAAAELPLCFVIKGNVWWKRHFSSGGCIVV